MVTKANDAMSLDLPSDREIVMTREFDAPRTLVFRAWTDPVHLARWWGPQGMAGEACRVDLRVGGEFRVELRAPDGAIYPCIGTFREIVEPERIVFTGAPDGAEGCGAGLPPNATVTVTFVEREGRTTLTIHTRLSSAADCQKAVDCGFNGGWATCLERLAEFLEHKAV